MTEPNIVKRPPTGNIKEAADAYALAVGHVSTAWNALHWTLGGLFAAVIGGDARMVLAAWRSVENDRGQREMLRAAIKAASPERWKHTPKALADLLWVLGRADALSDVRNDAIHALVALRIGPEVVEVSVAQPPKGKRERKLLDHAAKGRKLLDEFAKCELDADALNAFARSCTAALAKPGRQEWPTPRPKQTWVSPS